MVTTVHVFYSILLLGQYFDILLSCVLSFKLPPDTQMHCKQTNMLQTLTATPVQLAEEVAGYLAVGDAMYIGGPYVFR